MCVASEFVSTEMISHAARIMRSSIDHTLLQADESIYEFEY